MQRALVNQIIAAQIREPRLKLGELHAVAHERGRQRFSASELSRFALALKRPAAPLLAGPSTTPKCPTA